MDLYGGYIPKVCMLCTVKNFMCPISCVALAQSQCQVLSYRDSDSVGGESSSVYHSSYSIPFQLNISKTDDMIFDSLSKCFR